MEWFNNPPTEPGNYWFFGDLHYGTMGCHFFDPPKLPDQRMSLVTIRKTGGESLMAVADGHFVSLNCFIREKHRQGYVGYWKSAELPEPPHDILNLFIS